MGTTQTTSVEGEDGRPLSGSGSVALVHDYLLVMRGAERTFAAMSGLWPQAPIYTLLYDRPGTKGHFDGRELHVSRLRHLRARQAGFRRLLPLFPHAIQNLHPAGYDTVISSSSAFAHGVRTDPATMHVCYCHTPFRYAWHDYPRAVGTAPWYSRPFVRRTLQRIRDWDVEAAERVDHFIANSHMTRERVQDFWQQEATVVHPPVDVDRFHVDEPHDYFLVVAELVAHKRVDIAIEAATRSGHPIKIVGSGPEERRLVRLYGSTAEFLGRVSEAELADLYAHAKALVVANVEEFGMAAVEAQAAGRPVLGASVGGTSETVIDGETGVLVTPENIGALAEAMSQVDFDSFSSSRIRAHAAQFSVAAFRKRFAEEIERLSRARGS